MTNAVVSHELTTPTAVVQVARPRFLLTTIQVDGVVRYRLPILQEMLRRGWEVHAAAPDGAGLEELRRQGVVTHTITVDRGNTNPLREYKTLRQFNDLITEINPGLSHHFSTKAVIFGCLPNVGLNVATVTGVGYSLSGAGSSLKHLPVQIVAKMMYRAAMRHCDRVIFQNEHDQQLFVKKKIAQPEQTEVIPGSGIDMSHFHPSKWKPHSEPIRFVLLARMLISKGVADFVEAAELTMKRTGKKCEFILVGPLDPENPSSIAQAQIREWVDQGVVKWDGAVEDSVEAYAQADVAVLPSYYNEGLSRSLVEAAAMGLPIITTDNAGCRDTVDPGRSGIVVPMRNVEALADAMCRLAEDVAARRDMGQRGRMFVENRFSLNRVLDQVLSTYNRVLIQGGKPGLA